MNTVLENCFLTEDQRWDAVNRRDALADRVFFFAVKTTGVYCRPSCASRPPRRENVLFFESWQEAENAGFRACKRCQPKNNPGETAQQSAILTACEILAQAETQPTLESLASAVGLSPFYFQRLFKKIVGVTPKQYFLEKRSSRIRGYLQQDERVTDAIYHSGYGSNSRFYSQAVNTLGMRPMDYHRGAEGMQIAYAVSQSYLGWVLVAATATGVCAIEFGDAPEALEKRVTQRFPGAVLTQGDAAFSKWVAGILAFLDSPSQGLDLPLDIQGTAFQHRVWMALKAIPCGSTLSYADLAVKIGSPKAVRAVAHACATNRIAVAIPCHRVLRSDGSLGGYRWGVDRKRKLLERESDSSSHP
jgi:AraC family transcriptional regulator of adaptative response/methylated-DNA-[protein]-cysteine methyltransferase